MSSTGGRRSTTRTLLRIGLIGAGRWGRVYLRTLRSFTKRCRLTHLCTSQSPAVLDVPSNTTIVKSWRALIDARCDLIIIATPPHTHAELLLACLEAGIPCLVEKPLCLDAETARRLHERVHTSGVPVLVNHTPLFHVAYPALKAALARDATPIRSLILEGMGFGPFRTHTSALWDWAPHDLSVCLDLLGRWPNTIAALGGPQAPDGTSEQVSVRLDFPGGSCAWIQAGRLSTQKRRRVSVLTDRRVYVLDEQAAHPLMVGSYPFAHRYQRHVEDGLTLTPLRVPSHDSPMTRLIIYALDGLQGGDRRLFGTTLAYRVVQLLAACDTALRHSTPIRFTPHQSRTGLRTMRQNRVTRSQSTNEEVLVKASG